MKLRILYIIKYTTIIWKPRVFYRNLNHIIWKCYKYKMLTIIVPTFFALYSRCGKWLKIQNVHLTTAPGAVSTCPVSYHSFDNFFFYVMFLVVPQDRRRRYAAINNTNTRGRDIIIGYSTTAGLGTWWVGVRLPTSCCPACWDPSGRTS